MTSGDNNFNDFPSNGDGTSLPGGGTTTVGGGTPDTGGGTPFRPVPAEFNHCARYRRSLVFLTFRDWDNAPTFLLNGHNKTKTLHVCHNRLADVHGTSVLILIGCIGRRYLHVFTGFIATGLRQSVCAVIQSTRVLQT